MIKYLLLFLLIPCLCWADGSQFENQLTIVGSTADNTASGLVVTTSEDAILLAVRNDGAMRIPYLADAPTGLQNGMIWMESDGIHIYRDGAEKTVTDS